MPLYPIANTASVYQLVRSGNMESYSVAPIATNVNISCSPMGTDIQPAYGNVPAYQLFEIFVYDTTLTLHNGDKIVTNDAVTYYVDGTPYVISNKYLAYIRCLARQEI